MSQPPMGWTYRNPLSSMCCTMRPIWSQWPASMTRGGSPDPEGRSRPGWRIARTLP